MTNSTYTGPKWVGPLFKWLAILAVTSYVAGYVMDNEVEWECNE
jgi:hypothetical protein